MKLPSDDLFSLVHSLTAAERRYFRKFATQHIANQDNQYLLLFDALLKMDNYDEAAIKKQLRHFKIGGYLAVAKGYLYEQIGECLRQFHKIRSPEEKLKERLFFITLLLQRGLHDQARKLIIKAKKETQRYQFFHLLPELLELERVWMDRTFYRASSEDDIDNWQREYQLALEQLADQAQQASLGSRIARIHYQKISMVQAQARQAIETLLAQTPLPGENLRAQLDRLKALSTWHFINGEAEAAYDCNLGILTLMEQHTFLIELEPKRYLVALNNFLIDKHQLKRYSELAEGLVKLKSLSYRREFKQVPQLEEKIFELSTLLELNAWVDQGQFAVALHHIPTIKIGLEKHGKRLSAHYRLTFYYLIGYIYFKNKENDEALSWVGLLLQQAQKNVVEEIFRFARWLQILIHFEQGHYSLVEHLMQAQRRQLGQQESQSKTERLIFTFIKKLLNASGAREQGALFEQLANALLVLKQEPAEKRVLTYLDFEAWAAANIHQL